MPFCRDCGNQIGEGDQFCKQCGAAQQPGTAPGGQQPQAQPPPAAAAGAAGTAPSNKTPLYILIGVLSFVVLAGIIVGIVFLVKGCSGEQAVEEADKYVAEALGYIDEVDEIEDDLIAETKDLDFSVGAEQFQVEVSSIQDQLQDATVKLDAAASSLQKIDRPSLPDWWDTYISLLERAYEEKRQAYQEWQELITRLTEITEFIQAYEAMVNTYNAALDLIDQAVAQHSVGCNNYWLEPTSISGYTNAINLANAALAQLADARAQMERASQLEPGVDISQVANAITQLEDYATIVISSSNWGAAGNHEQHWPLCDQVRGQYGSLPRDISFDMVSWVASIIDEYVVSIEEHLAKEAEYRRRAAEVWAQNNP